jgi:hypothetical protein
VVFDEQRVGTCIVTHRGPTSAQRHEPHHQSIAAYGCTLISEEPGIRANVLVGARTCLTPDIPITATVADPNLAGQYAQRLASEILASIHF